MPYFLVSSMIWLMSAEAVRHESVTKFCSLFVQVEVIQRGRSWQLVQQLVNINFNQLHWRDRYCTTCMQSFSSQHCLSHMSHHPVEHVLVDIAMEEGFPFIVDPDEQLPEVICSRVTVSCELIQVPNLFQRHTLFQWRTFSCGKPWHWPQLCHKQRKQGIQPLAISRPCRR